jgi:hypothetical protein
MDNGTWALDERVSGVVIDVADLRNLAAGFST